MHRKKDKTHAHTSFVHCPLSMNEPLLLSSIVGGIFVILSYVYLYFDDDAEKAWGGIEGQWRMVWFLSTLLTTICYIFLWVSFVFFIEEQSMLLLTSWLIFLLSASQWSLLTLIDIKEQRKSIALLTNLIVTATASVGIWLVCMLLENHEALRGWLIAASSIMVLHHAVADAWLWYAAFPNLDFVPV